MPLALPADTWRVLLGFTHPHPGAGFSETYYLNLPSPTVSTINAKLDLLVNARKVLLDNHCSILWARMTFKVTGRKRVSHKKTYGDQGAYVGTIHDVVMPPEVALFYQWECQQPDETLFVKTGHYLGGMPSDAITSNTAKVTGVETPPTGYWALMQTFMTTIKSDYVQVYRTGVAPTFTLKMAKIDAVIHGGVRDRDRGRPLGVLSGIHLR